MLTLHYYDDFVLLQRLVEPSNETNCTPVTSETPNESFSSDTVGSLNLQRCNIRNSLLLRLVKGVDSTRNDWCESGDCPADEFGCLDIFPPLDRPVLIIMVEEGVALALALATCTVREMKTK